MQERPCRPKLLPSQFVNDCGMVRRGKVWLDLAPGTPRDGGSQLRVVWTGRAVEFASV